jgi:hypothetical protein
MNDLGNSISKALTFNAHDMPFALVYFCSTDFGTHGLQGDADLARRSSSDSNSNNVSEWTENDPTTITYTLQSTVGIPEDHPLAPTEIEIHPGLDVDDEQTQFIWPFRKMAVEQKAMEVPLNPESMKGILHQGWPEPPTSAVTLPIFGSRDLDGKEIMTGILIVGLNQRRIFDEDYLTWVRICSRHIAAAMNMVRNAEEAAERAEEMAVLSRNRTTFFNR